jgi:polysaccharide export outer membrane protein
MGALTALLLVAAPLASSAQQQPQNGNEPPPLNPMPGGAAAAPHDQQDPAAGPINAKIAPGDHLAIAVYGDQSLSQVAIVQSDGTIQYNLIGRVHVAGQTPAQARETLTRAFQRYIKHPVVSVAIQQAGLMNVLVMGNVRQQGRFQIRSGGHVSEAIAAAGGVAQVNGGYPKARVELGDGTSKLVDLQKLFSGGDSAQNIALQSNATVYVTGAETIRVQVLGAVTRPGIVDVFVGDRLDQALARAGADAQARPDFNDIYINRKAADGKITRIHVNLYDALKKGDMNADPVLQKDDTVLVPQSRGGANAAGVAGGIFGMLGHFFGF